MDIDEVREAVDLLVATNKYAEIKKELKELIDTRSTIPRRFAGELAPLNALIALEGASREAFDSVMELVEKRRRTVPTTNKADYMRGYMFQQRARLKTAITIEEITRGSRLSPTARENLKQAQLSKWMVARDAHIASRGPLKWKERNEVAADFWRKIDEQLEQQLIDVKLAHKPKQK